MANKGLLYSPLAIIQNLRHTLRSGYDPESIPRELLQNADDAGAGCLHFGWSPGLPTSTTANPLLRDPALFAVNDGLFTEENALAIRRVGISSKSGDGGTIGKFGLGLKSVFCVCEAFYFVAGENPQRPRFHDVINPWSDTGLPGVEDWDQFGPAEAEAVLRAIAPALDGLRRYFVLWLPLRVRDRLAGCDPIHGEWFDDRTCPPEPVFNGLGPRFAGFLPLLHSVRAVRLWDLGRGAERFGLRFPEGARRLPRPNGMQGREEAASGVLALTEGGSAGELHHAARTVDLTERCSSLRRSEHWPRTYCVRGAAEESVPEENPAHAGVCWQLRSARTGPGRLEWRWAAFLPLRRSHELPLPDAPAGFDCLLTLHASGFVNPARTDFLEGPHDDPPADPEQLYRAWNHTLTRQGTLPLIPESLLDFRDQARLSDTQVAALVRALASDQFSGQTGYREAICSRRQLVYRWEPEGTGWVAVPPSARLLGIPAPRTEGDALAVPLLRDLGGRRGTHLILEGWPRLGLRGAGWTPDLLCQALDGASAGAAGLGYLARFVSATVPADAPPEVVSSLAGLVRRLLGAFADDADRRQHLRDIAGKLPPGRLLCLPLPPDSEDGCRFLRAAAAAPGAGRLVPLPEDLGLKGEASPTADEAVAILSAWCREPGPADLRSALAVRVLRFCRPDALHDALEVCRGLRLFRAHRVAGGEAAEVAATAEEIASARAAGRLFADDGTGWATALSRATGAVLLLAPRAVAALFGPEPVPCDLPASASFLLECCGGPLGDPADRIPLLTGLASSQPPPVQAAAHRRAVRLLLHGTRSQQGSTAPLLFDRHDSGLWGRIVHAALGEDDRWRLIHPDLAGHVPPHGAGEFGLGAVTSRTAENELRRLGAEGLRRLALDFTPEEATELLREIHQEDILMGLPIHAEAATGHLRRIDSPWCFWDGGERLPNELSEPPVLLRRNADLRTQGVQERIARPIGHADVVLILLRQNEPHRHAAHILDSFYSLGRAVPQVVLEALKGRAWLPAPQGPVQPGSVLHLPEMADALASLPLEVFQGLVPSSRLLEVGGHSGIQALANLRLVPPQEEALGLLGEALAEDARFHVGDPAGVLTDDAQGHSDLNSFLQAFEGAPDDVMPARPLASAADRMAGRGPCVRAFIGRLRHRLPQDRLLRVLAFLSDRHEKGGPREHIERVYLWYLGLVERPQSGCFPGGIRLLSRAGKWRPPSGLCVGADAINPEYRLDERQLELLMPSHGARQAAPRAAGPPRGPAAPQGAVLDAQLTESVRRLTAYFEGWERARPHLRPVIGGFLAALGDGPAGAVRRLAEQYLSPACELDALRERMRQCVAEGTPPVRFDSRRVLVEVIAAQTVRVTSLSGTPLDAPLVQSVESILIPFGDGLFITEQGAEQGRPVQVTRLRLRQLDAVAHADRMTQLLERATYDALQGLYWLFLRQEVFAPLVHADSQQLRAAQNLILDNAPLYLGQLGVAGQGRLSEAVRQMHLARNLAAQEEVATEHLTPGFHAPAPQAPERRQQARAALQSRLREPETQAAVLEAIRRKVSVDFAYAPESVPFEILQNADDATMEASDEGRDWFGVWASGGCVVFLHEGRAINQPPVGRPHDPLLGHERDLEKMLVLASSDKPAAAQGLTGKFGLGFKSVFLVCDQPLARSGALGFRVLGGLYPEGLSGAEARRLEDLFTRVSGRPFADRNGTVLELPLRDGRSDAFLDRFLALLPVALAFTRRLRRCAIRAGEEGDVVWAEPEPVPEVPGVSVGLLDGSRLFRRQRVLALALGERRALLLGLNAEGVCALPDEVPTVWVTAPTRVECRVGFAVNAPFDLDVGRTQLQREEANHHRLADELGAELGRCLVALRDADWVGIRRALGLRAELTREQFWGSVWALLGAGLDARRRGSDELALRMLQRAMYGREGLRRLYSERYALPTGLSGARHGGLALLGNVKHRLAGCLDEDPRLLTRVESWPAMARMVRAGELVSESRVWGPLSGLLPAGAHRADPLDLARLMEWELEDPLVEPERAARLGELITRSFVESLEGLEGKQLRLALRKARFLHAGRGDGVPGRLLARGGPGVEQEEGRRAAFAPPDRRLRPDYQGAGLAFFLACRDRMAATADEMAEWFRAAEGAAREAALGYLEYGEQALQVSQRLRLLSSPGDWWRERLGGGGLGETARVLIGLAAGQPPPLVPPEAVPAPRPVPTAEEIRRWWERDRAALRERHLAWTYPAFLRADVGPSWLHRDRADVGTTEGRRRWVSLLLLAMMHGFGRAGRHSEQRRGFLEECERRGWIDRFAAPADDSRWVAFIDDFVRDRLGHIPYFHAFRSAFVGTRVIVRWLADHREVFRQMGNRPGPFSLLQAMRPGSDEHLRGSGISPPPLAQVLGAVGASFLLRELVRGGFFADPTNVVPHCYAATASVRRLLGAMGCPGMADSDDRWAQPALIHGFLRGCLADPTFGGDYDIPLWLFVSERPEYAPPEEDEP